MRDDVEVVFYAIEPVQMAFFVFEYAPDVLEKFLPLFFMEGSFPLFGAENNLIQDLRISHGKYCSCDSTAKRLVEEWVLYTGFHPEIFVFIRRWRISCLSSYSVFSFHTFFTRYSFHIISHHGMAWRRASMSTLLSGLPYLSPM